MMNRLSIGTKLNVAFAILLVAILTLGGAGLECLSRAGDAAANIAGTRLPRIANLANLLTALEACRVDEARLALAGAGADRAIAAQALADDVAAVDYWRAGYDRLLPPDRDGQGPGLLDGIWLRHKAMIASAAASGGGSAPLLAERNSTPFLQLTAALRQELAAGEQEAEDAAAEGAAASSRARMTVLAILMAGVVTCLTLCALVFARVIVPLRHLSQTARRIAGGDRTAVVQDCGRGDEIGELAGALAVFRENLATADRLAAERHSERLAKEDHVARLDGMMQRFEHDAGLLAARIASAATELEATSQALAGNAAQTDHRAGSAGRAAGDASAAVQTVAAAAEQLSVSIGEITRQVAQSATVSQNAVREARRTDTIVRALADGASKIGQVVDLITTIAGQTNLLALNATIEAARAGDAGRGFAVVASEVKELANQTARATQEISRNIADIQSSTTEAVRAINAIASTIEQVSAIATTIAAAVAQQGAATEEIARNVQTTATATQTVTADIAGVTQMASETGSASGHVLTAAADLLSQADQLSRQVRVFLQDARAA